MNTITKTLTAAFLLTMIQACGQPAKLEALGKTKFDADFAASGQGEVTMASSSDDGEAVAKCEQTIDQSSVETKNEYDIHVFIRKIVIEGKTVLRARFVGKNSEHKISFDDKDSGYIDLQEQSSSSAQLSLNGLKLLAGVNAEKTDALAFSWSFNEADKAEAKLESGNQLSLLLAGTGSVSGSGSGSAAATSSKASTDATSSTEITAGDMTCENVQ